MHVQFQSLGGAATVDEEVRLSSSLKSCQPESDLELLNVAADMHALLCRRRCQHSKVSAN